MPSRACPTAPEEPRLEQVRGVRRKGWHRGAAGDDHSPSHQPPATLRNLREVGVQGGKERGRAGGSLGKKRGKSDALGFEFVSPYLDLF